MVSVNSIIQAGAVMVTDDNIVQVHLNEDKIPDMEIKVQQSFLLCKLKTS